MVKNALAARASPRTPLRELNSAPPDTRPNPSRTNKKELGMEKEKTRRGGKWERGIRWAGKS